jgi:hypothetical protein
MATTFSKKSSSTHCVVGLAREVEDEHLRLRPMVADGRFQLGEEVTPGVDGNVADVGAGDHRPVDVDRVARIGHQQRVAAVQRGQREVGDALLRADGDDGLAFRVEVDVVAALVPVADRAAQARDAFRHRVAMRIAALRGLDSFSTMCGGVGWSGLPMPKSMMSSPRRRAAILSSPVIVEDVGRQALDSGKFVHV